MYRTLKSNQSPQYSWNIVNTAFRNNHSFIIILLTINPLGAKLNCFCWNSNQVVPCIYFLVALCYPTTWFPQDIFFPCPSFPMAIHEIPIRYSPVITYSCFTDSISCRVSIRQGWLEPVRRSFWAGHTRRSLRDRWCLGWPQVTWLESNKNDR